MNNKIKNIQENLNVFYDSCFDDLLKSVSLTFDHSEPIPYKYVWPLIFTVGSESYIVQRCAYDRALKSFTDRSKYRLSKCKTSLDKDGNICVKEVISVFLYKNDAFKRGKNRIFTLRNYVGKIFYPYLCSDTYLNVVNIYKEFPYKDVSEYIELFDLNVDEVEMYLKNNFKVEFSK